MAIHLGSPQYAALITGYTSRIVNQLLVAGIITIVDNHFVVFDEFLDEEISDHNKSILHKCFHFNETEYIQNFLRNIILCNDTVWGHGDYIFKTTNLMDKYRKPLGECVLIKCEEISDVINHVKVLENLFYCVFMSIDHLFDMRWIDEEKIIVMHFDTESV